MLTINHVSLETSVTYSYRIVSVSAIPYILSPKPTSAFAKS
jgi:hypothetical protein